MSDITGPYGQQSQGSDRRRNILNEISKALGGDRGNPITGIAQAPPKVLDVSGMDNGYSPPTSEDPLQNWYYQTRATGGSYKMGSQPQLEAQLAIMLGWDGQGDPYSYLGHQASTSRYTTDMGRGVSVPTEIIKNLLGQALGI